ncbi:MAG: hypothetical protein JWO80_6166 [Bryobacterales bacterium]|nr:hypothetical protein [Bryobacterales bacterium]
MNVEPIRKILPYTTVAVVLAALYVAYTFYSRRDEQQRVEHASVEREAEAARDSLNRLGGGNLKIDHFFATPAAVSRGQAAKLCYGVAFAKTVRIEPETESIWPALARCIDVRPAKTTHYTLTAADAQGHIVTKTTDIAVQ